VEYVVDGQSVSLDHVKFDDFIPTPEGIEKPGYTFIGWSLTENQGELWNFATDKMPAKNLTFYAQFTINECTLTYIDEVGTLVEQLPMQFNTDLSEPVMSQKVGYDFVGWYTERDGGRQWNFAEDTMPASDLTLYARFIVKQYKLIYEVEGKNHGEPVDVSFDDVLPQPVEPTKVGHTFVGWYTESEGGRQWNFAEETMPAADMTLYARFTVNVYNVTYVDDTGKSSEPIGVNFDALLSEPTRPEKIGHHFLGWYTEKRGGRMWRFDTNKMPAGDVTLYARYMMQSYEVRYVNDNGSLYALREVDFGEEVLAPRDPQKAGHRFLGWYTEATGGRAWDFENEMMPGHELALYARYEKL